MAQKNIRSDVRSSPRIVKGPAPHSKAGMWSPTGLGRNVLPNMTKVSKYDHGEGPKEFTHMNQRVAGTGRSQSPKQIVLNSRGHAKQTGG